MKKFKILTFLFAVLSLAVYSQKNIDWGNLPTGTDKIININEKRDNAKFELTLTNLGGRKIKSVLLEYGGNNLGDLLESAIEADASKKISINVRTLLEHKKYYDKIKLKTDDEFFITLIDDNSVIGGTALDKELKLTYKLKAIETDSFKEKTELEKQKEIAQYVKLHYSSFAAIYENTKNNIIKKENTVHIFLDEYGKTYFTSLPTTAREDFDYQFHVFYYPEKTTLSIFLEYDGTYDPDFVIYGEDQLSKIKFSGTDREDEIKKEGPQEIIFGTIGPFTNTFTVAIKKKTKNNNKENTEIIISKTIKVAKVHHISVSAGLIGSFLRNPSDLEKYPLSNGDTTVIANDPTSRGLITLMATFYPLPRNLLFAPTNWKERIGFVVGTRIDKDFNENFLAGISFDLARGISLTGGVHYGRVNKLVYDGDFEFGKTKFTGELKSKKEWELGWYIGTCIDLRVFGLLFNLQPAN